jgi:hypothetical protein
MGLVLLLSAAYALAGNAFLYSAYFNNDVMKWSYIISTFMVIGYAIPIVVLFRNRHWYFPPFIFLFWIPFSVLFALLFGKALPLADDDYGFALLIVYFLILNVFVIVLGILLGMVINACWMLWSKFARKETP